MEESVDEKISLLDLINNAEEGMIIMLSFDITEEEDAKDESV